MINIAYMGIDVQVRRGCSCAVLNENLMPYGSDWLNSPAAIGDLLITLLRTFDSVAVGIDAPRCPLTVPRPYYWNGRNWHARQPQQRGRGRHCEVVVAALGLGNPQWTPLVDDAPEWMRVGFSLFSALSKHANIYEVFPTASYRQLAHDRSAQLSISLAAFEPGPKDMLDAFVAAFTVHELLAGRGIEVGGGDSLGTIVLPRPLTCGECDVLRWPKS